ncbi:hypothetical protein [Pseudobutyrivibrio sp.]|uniref:hypothetical protein n=1 Tax=Pseudobutyrivibrio sp. TaxID=2014367 RepID=UPI001E197139|nr:hypothetical protein [Pseudobutyrivibrio sp.]MBE5910446.1 hypothetical protein [Pseudobutyrivibrio sp.]
MPVTNLGQALNIENDPTFSQGITEALNTFINNVMTNGTQKNERWKQNKASKLSKVGVREFTEFPWSMAEDQYAPLDDAKYQQTINYAFVSKDVREKMMDEFYDTRAAVDYRNFDFSALLGQGVSADPAREGLSQSEKDVVRFISHMVSSQTEGAFKKENPDYYNERMQLLTPQEQFMARVNSEYLTAAWVPVEYMLKKKHGYQSNWAFEQNNIDSYNEGINNYSNAFATLAENMEVAHQIYSYRMAMVKNEPNPPQPVIKFKVPDRWNPLHLKEFGQRLENRDTSQHLRNFDHEFEACQNMYDAMFGHFKTPMGVVNPEIKEFDNIFIDNRSVADYCSKFAPQNVEDKIKVYKATIVSAILSGDHTVETAVRYMKPDGNMDVKLFAVEPDLTAVARRENARHSWFRRLFNWGPFKLDNAKRRQARRIAADTAQSRSARHTAIEGRYHVAKPTTDNPKQIIFPENEPVKIKDEVRGVYKQAYENWLTTLREKRVGEKINQLNVNKQDWNTTKSMIAAIDRIGVGNTIKIFTRNDDLALASDDTVGSTYKKAIETYKAMPDNYQPTISKREAFDRLMNYFFKHGGLENENASFIVDAAGGLAVTEEQKKFANSLAVMNEGREQYDKNIMGLANLRDKGVKLGPENVKDFDKNQIQKNVNKILCDSVIKQLSEKKPFDNSILQSQEVQKINKLAENDGKEYKHLVESVVKEANLDENREITAEEQLKNIHANIDKVPENIKSAIEKVIAKNQPVAENNLNPQKQVEKNIQVQAHNQNPVLA